MTYDRDRWRSNQTSHAFDGPPAVPHNGLREGVGPLVRPGCIIVRDRLPWRVLEINEMPEDLWPDPPEREWQQKVAAWQEYEAARLRGEPESWGAERKARPPLVRAEWHRRPIVLILQPVDKPQAKLKHIWARADLEWQILPEHYSVCRVCGELPPCRHQETETTVTKAMADTERLMAIPHGACLGCGKAISSRMKSIRFPGPNLWRPDWGTDTAVFHLRDQDRGHYYCTNATSRYREQWKAAGYDNLTASNAPEGPK